LLKAPVTLIICDNGLKEDPLFSLEERLDIVLGVYGVTRAYVAHDRHSIEGYIRGSRTIIRGVRDDEDITYISRLVRYYGVEDQVDKLLIIQVPQPLLKVSSTKLKQLVAEGDIFRALEYAPSEVISRIQEKMRRMQ
jgi:phosphopantetheine adenylyltransferase